MTPSSPNVVKSGGNNDNGGDNGQAIQASKNIKAMRVWRIQKDERKNKANQTLKHFFHMNSDEISVATLVP